mgnify:CR=1 FL=1
MTGARVESIAVRVGVDSPQREDHAVAIVSEGDLSLTECLEVTAAATPVAFPNLVRHLDPEWIEEALLTTGTATLRRRRLPADRMIWLVLGMAVLRDMPITEVARQLEVALPATWDVGITTVITTVDHAIPRRAPRRISKENLISGQDNRALLTRWELATVPGMKLDRTLQLLAVLGSVSSAGACGAEPSPGDDDADVLAPDARDPEPWGERCNARPGDDGDTIAFLDFEVRGHGLAALDGAVVRLLTHQWDDPERVFGIAEVTIADGAFAALWPDGYQRFSYQPVIIHVDADGNGRCDPDVELGRHFFSNAWNPVGDEPLAQDVTLFPLEPATAAICAEINRCGS